MIWSDITFKVSYNKEMSNKLIDALKTKKVLVADGAWGTEIEKIKNPRVQYPEILNISQPEIIEKIALSYIEAGSDIILTNTFGGNRLKLKKYGAEEKIEQINKKGVEISRKVAGNRLVFASIGPTGELLKPYGNLTEKEAIDCFSQQVRILTDAEVDGIVIETMSDVGEARCALMGAKTVTDKPVIVCFTFNITSSGYRTLMGNNIYECVEMAKTYGADAVGSNCGSGIETFIDITKEIRKFTQLPVWIKPNAGIPELVSGKTIYPETPEHMVTFIPELIKSGASIIGGCCGTTPLHIKKIVQKVFEFVNMQ
ncbi:MAG: homocysteine S-methyltransferase family protein [bacterium]|nr:homocysteine S-methyltransferase family protein [bacterium]